MNVVLNALLLEAMLNNNSEICMYAGTKITWKIHIRNEIKHAASKTNRPSAFYLEHSNTGPCAEKAYHARETNEDELLPRFRLAYANKLA